MKSNDKSLPLPVLLKSMTEELHIADLPEGCSNTEVQAVRTGSPAKIRPVGKYPTGRIRCAPGGARF